MMHTKESILIVIQGIVYYRYSIRATLSPLFVRACSSIIRCHRATARRYEDPDCVILATDIVTKGRRILLILVVLV